MNPSGDDELGFTVVIDRPSSSGFKIWRLHEPDFHEGADGTWSGIWINGFDPRRERLWVTTDLMDVQGVNSDLGLYFVDLRTRKVRFVSREGGSGMNVQPSPDGTMVAFEVGGHPSWYLPRTWKVIDLDSGRAKPFGDSTAEGRFPSIVEANDHMRFRWLKAGRLRLEFERDGRWKLWKVIDAKHLLKG
jgi:hypothetical protein